MGIRFEDFPKVVRGWRRELENFRADIAKAVISNTFRNIIELSPVRSGQWRANNFVSIGQRSDRVNLFPKVRGRLVPSNNAGMNVNEARATIDRIDGKTKEVHITNNLVYSTFLERGGSKTQAPGGIYDPSIKRMLSNGTIFKAVEKSILKRFKVTI